MSTTERSVDVALKNVLVKNEPFQYAHLIKFERPSRPDALSGRVSTSAQRYTYLTDASVNVSFNDLSTNLQGTQNGTQVYLANKVLSVGAIQEQTKATTSSTSVVLDGNAIGAYLAADVIISGSSPTWDIALQAPFSTDDLLSAGFREGDKVSVNGTKVNIQSFRANNTLRVSRIDDTLATGPFSACEFSLASEEIISILLNKNAADYASFINREVYIYKAYFQNGTLIGDPVLVFKGIIQNVSFEDSESAIRVTWGLGSHWGDFSQVKGRITSDSSHRALDANGIPQPESALKVAYAYDKGFNHAELSVNLLSKYSVMVEKIDVSSKKGFLGIGASVKTKKQLVPEDRNTALDFQLNAKSIPVIYGVRMAEGIPIFADTLNDDSSTVYAAVALSEGEIGGIYDLYIDGLSLICNDKADSDTRSAGVTRTEEENSSIQLTCIGRSDKGEVLNGTATATGSIVPFYVLGKEIGSINRQNFNFITNWYTQLYTPPSNISTPNDYGVIHGESISLTTPQEFTLDVFTGKPGQKAASSLSTIAYNKNFRVQQNYWTGTDTSEYWGPNHKLLDTAYIVGKYKIKDGETTIPEIKFVVRGKVVECYNYDYSFSHDDKTTGESEANFLLGETVTLYRSSDDAPIGTGQIIDKWTFMNPDGTPNTRFRIDQVDFETALQYVNDKPTVTKFYMKKSGSTNRWTMITHNYNIYGAEQTASSGKKVVATAISSPISSFSGAGSKLIINYTSNADMAIDGDPIDATAKFQVLNSDYTPVTTGSLLPYAIFVGTSVTSTALTTGYDYNDYSADYSAYTTGYILASRNTIELPSDASSTASFYNGYLIEIVRYDTSTNKTQTQTAEIIGYSGSTTKIATIDSIWDFVPQAGDNIRIYPKYADRRVSINPAMQLMDYITSPSYGRELDPYNDLDIDSWKESGRKCDTRSDVTVLVSGTPTDGDIYKYTNSAGNIIWQGKVASSFTVSGVTGRFVTFTDVIGKLTNKWNSWKTFKEKEIIYNTDGTLFVVNTPNVYAVEPTSASVPAGLSLVSSGTFTLARVSGTGTDPLSVSTIQGNPVQLWKDGAKISGYSLYDCDDINYWRTSGWDEHSQRYVTKNQCNISIDTSIPLLDNINAILEHFNGILRYASGKYYLDVEELDSYESLAALPSTGNYVGRSVVLTTDNLRYRYNELSAWELDIRTITTDDIIGKIQLTDEGTRSAFNSLTASFADPANKFEPRNISFFNSDYLKADRNVPKKGNLSIPGITNYYNTRLLADSFLNKSRFGLSISMTVRYHGVLLLAGTVIQVVYPRYSWDKPGKSFRIESVNLQPDGLVDIVAREYDDSFYGLTNIRKASSAATSSTTNTGTAVGYNAANKPTDLLVTSADTATELINGVELVWNNDPTVNNSSSAFTEVYGSISPNLYVTVSSVSGSVLTTSSEHGLLPGMPVYPISNYNTLISGNTYYVVSTPSATTFSLSATKVPTTLISPGDGSGLTVKIRTATLLATVPVPTNKYMDTVPNEGTGRVEKYYWVRHRVNTI